MKSFLLIASLALGSLMFVPSNATASVIIPAHSGKIIPAGDFLKNIATLKVKDLQKKIGRKLTIKEKIGFLVLKHKIKRSGKAEPSKGQTAMVFGIVAISLLVLSFFVPYVIVASFISSIVAIVSGSSVLRQNKNDRKAFVGKLLGWITLGLIALLLILAVIWLSSWGLF